MAADPRGAEGSSPQLAREQRVIEHGGRSRLDQGGGLDQRLAHGVVHRPDRTMYAISPVTAAWCACTMRP
jgi:hypothetical protein